MSLHSWLRPVAHNRKRTNSIKPRHRRLRLEQLEERRVLSFDFGYALALGSDGIDQGRAVAADSDGNVVVAVSFSSASIDLDPGPGSYILPSAGGWDSAVAKYDPLGNLLWGVQLASTANNFSRDVAVDGVGNILFAGTFEGSLEIRAPGQPPVTLTNGGLSEGFLAKIDPAGAVLWATTFGVAGSPRDARGVAADAVGDVYVTGLEGSNLFAAKYSAGGAAVWTTVVSEGAGIDNSYAYGEDLAVDAGGNVHVTGSYSGTIDFNSDPTQAHSLTGDGGSDAFVLKLNASGAYVWAGSMGGRDSDGGQGIALDAAGNVYVNGYSWGDPENDFDPGVGNLTLPGNGLFGWVVMLDPNRNLLWGTSGVGSREIALDGAGAVYTTAEFTGTFDADPGPGTFTLTAGDKPNAFVSKLNSAGSFVWAGAMGGPEAYFNSNGIAVDGQGNIFTTGSFRGTADFDPGAGTYSLTSALNSSGNPTSDVFVSKLVPVILSPTLSINDVSMTEGNSGSTTATFTVTRFGDTTQEVTVSYATADGTATAGSDYQAVSGTLTILAGQTIGMISVPVSGDRVAEANETFFMNLGNATNATIADDQGVGTIVDDEPRISISDVSKSEGKRGKTTLFTFTVTLSAAYDEAVSMSYRTVDGTAKTGDGDYVAKTGTLTFAPGETTKTITIEVKGDSKKEANETFYLDLFDSSSNSLFTKSRGLGTILNDD
ncbi:MAG TPA: Calx-beta domain-containing protein [Pirellulaceae bacterium]|nr:Calx-beta domain-containing protein [Pirellulaceae bacterium]